MRRPGRHPLMVVVFLCAVIVVAASAGACWARGRDSRPSRPMPVHGRVGERYPGRRLLPMAQVLADDQQSAAPAVAPSSEDFGFEAYATGGWDGQRQNLVDAGFSLGGQLVLEGFDNFRGGVDTGVVGASTLDLNLTLDTEKAFHWKGGTFYADLEDHAGSNPSAALTGDLQVFDKLNVAPYLQLYELWYQQRLLGGLLRLKLGKMDANNDFSVVDDGLPFLNSSDQVSPTLLGFPTTPDPMPGVNLFVTPGKSWYAGFGAYDANRSDAFGDIVGRPESVQPTAAGTFLIGEVGARWDRAPLLGAAGNLKLGAWSHSGTLTRLDGGRQTGAHGYYAVLDQTLWKPSDEPQQSRGVRCFLEAGRTQASVSSIDWNLAGGITWTGPLATRPHDVLGLSANYAHLASQAGLPYSYELALEGFYQLPVLKWATLQPDLQVIIHPGGQYPDALVGTLDLTINL